MNLRPLEPHSSTLPGLRYIPTALYHRFHWPFFGKEKIWEAWKHDDTDRIDLRDLLIGGLRSVLWCCGAAVLRFGGPHKIATPLCGLENILPPQRVIASSFALFQSKPSSSGTFKVYQFCLAGVSRASGAFLCPRASGTYRHLDYPTTI